ncbi:MAG: hypothetical protein ACPG49_05880 [Chitinophagales bacterium]
MNFKEIFPKITPFLIVCPVLMAIGFIYTLTIFVQGDTSISLLPYTLSLLFISTLFLVLDRNLVKNGQRIVIPIELLSMVFIYAGITSQDQNTPIEAKQESPDLKVVYSTEEQNAFDSKYIFPFNGEIEMTANN